MSKMRWACDAAAMNRIEPRGLWALVIVSALLVIGAGPTLDDYAQHQQVMDGALWTLYDFFGAEQVPELRYHGQLLPWWSSDELSMRFFRPLSSLVLSLDHWLLDGGGVLSHLHGLGWFALLLIVAHQVFKLVVGEKNACWATPLYAVASWHAVPLAFTASRHTHVTALLALSVFGCLARGFERSGQRWLAGALLGCALLAGESALLILPLATGWAIGAHGLRRAAAQLAPCAGVGCAYLLWYGWSGHGVVGSGQYLAPLSAEFLRELPLRWLALVADLLGSFSADLGLFGLWTVQAAWGVVTLVLLCLVSRRLYDDHIDRPLGGMLLGAGVSLVASSAAMPGGRALVIPGIAASALFATVIARSLQRPHQSRWLLAGALIFGIGLHPLLRVVIAFEFADSGRRLLASARTVSDQCRGKTVLAPAMADLSLVFLPSVIRTLGYPEPRAVHLLSISPNEHRLERVSASSYRLNIVGDFFESTWARNQRAAPLLVGSTTPLDGLDVTVTAIDPQTELLLSIAPESDLCWVTHSKNGPLVFSPGDMRVWTSGPAL